MITSSDERKAIIMEWLTCIKSAISYKEDKDIKTENYHSEIWIPIVRKK